MELVSLLSQPEGKTLEFKRDLSSPEGVLKTLVAFANTTGGTLLIGVEDGTRVVRGVKDVMAVEERLTSLIADSITPKLIPLIEIVPWRKTHVVAAEVHPSPNRPHYLNRLGPEQGVMVRVGSTNRGADASSIVEMKRYGRALSFDEEPMPDLNSEAIDFRAASEYFAPMRRLTAESLQTLRMTAKYQNRIVPTVGGMLLFGKERLERFPDAWVQVGRFAGGDKGKMIDSASVRGYLPGAAEEIIGFLQKHMMRETVIGAVRRTEVWTLPVVAIREAVMNAIVHADYGQQGSPIRIALFDERLEIENPGLLPFGLTIEDIQRGVSKLRNRVVGRVLQELGQVEHWGSGVQRMTAACLDRGLPAPRFEEIGTHFRVTLSTVRRTAAARDKTDQTILNALAAHAAKGLGTSVIAKRVKLSPRATRTRLSALVERGLVAEIGSGPQDPRRRYFLAPEAMAKE